jgi:dUTPase
MSLCGSVAPRSGLAWKHSIDVGAGVSMLTTGAQWGYTVQPFRRRFRRRQIAQLIIEKIMTQCDGG